MWVKFWSIHAAANIGLMYAEPLGPYNNGSSNCRHIMRSLLHRTGDRAASVRSVSCEVNVNGLFCWGALIVAQKIIPYSIDLLLH
jgi:hypothetical protein